MIKTVNSNTSKIYIQGTCLIIKHETGRIVNRNNKKGINKRKNKKAKKSKLGIWGKFNNDLLKSSIKPISDLPAKLEFSKKELFEILANTTCHNFKFEGHDTFSSAFIEEQIKKKMDEKLDLKLKKGFNENLRYNRIIELVYNKYFIEDRNPLDLSREFNIKSYKIKEIIVKIEKWQKEIKEFRFDLISFKNSINRWLKKYRENKEIIEKIGEDYRLNVLSVNGPSTIGETHKIYFYNRRKYPHIINELVMYRKQESDNKDLTSRFDKYQKEIQDKVIEGISEAQIKNRESIIKQQKENKKLHNIGNKMLKRDPISFSYFSMDLNKLEHAMDCIDEFIETNPNNAEAWCAKGLIFRNKWYNEFKETKKMIHQLISNGYVINQQEDPNVIKELIKNYEKKIKNDPYNIDLLNKKGNLLFKIKQYEKSFECFNKVKEIDSNNKYATFHKGIIYQKLEKFDFADNEFNNVLSQDSKFFEAWFFKGSNLCDLERYNEAIRCFNKTIKINSDFFPAWDLKRWLIRNYFLPHSISFFEKATKIEPLNADVWFHKGVTLNELDYIEEARDCLLKSVELNPNSKKGLSYYGLFLKYHPTDFEEFKEELYEMALEFINKDLEIEPTNINILKEKLDLLKNLYYYNEIIECCNKILKIEPNNIDVWLSKAKAYRNLDKYLDEFKCYDKIQMLDLMDENVLSEKSICLFYMKQYDKALDCIEEAINKEPQSIEFWNIKIQIYELTEQYEKAIQSLEYIINSESLQNENYYKSQFWYRKSEIFTKIKKYSEALQCIDNVLDLISSVSNESDYYDLLIEQAKLYEKQNNFSKAIICLDYAYEIYSDDFESLYYKATILEKTGNLEDAYKIYEKISKSQPNEHINLYTIAKSYHKLKKYKEAIKSYKLYVNNNEYDLNVWEDYGKTFEIIGDKENAELCYNNYKNLKNIKENKINYIYPQEEDITLIHNKVHYVRIDWSKILI
jgi:tetratricopeptide (TPR) repeat protein